MVYNYLLSKSCFNDAVAMLYTISKDLHNLCSFRLPQHPPLPPADPRCNAHFLHRPAAPADGARLGFGGVFFGLLKLQGAQHRGVQQLEEAEGLARKLEVINGYKIKTSYI